MHRVLAMALALLASQPGATAAQDRPAGHVWTVEPDTTTADLAAHNWSVVESTGLAVSEGGQAMVSFWERRVYNTIELMRCITAFDPVLNQTADTCARAAHPE